MLGNPNLTKVHGFQLFGKEGIKYRYTPQLGLDVTPATELSTSM